MITFNGSLYRAVLDASGRLVVIVQRGRQWRVASEQDTIRVLAGLQRPAIVR